MNQAPKNNGKKIFSYKHEDKIYHFNNGDGIFTPTDTTKLLISGGVKAIDVPGKFLDLGCGSGIIGIMLSILGKTQGQIHGSDLSQEAVEVAKANASNYGIDAIYKSGTLFQPWKGEKFDIILDDVPGISSKIREYSDWFEEGVPFSPGEDGADLMCQVLKEAPEYLNDNGVLIFPILSLSNTERILDDAKKYFNNVELVTKRMWALPKTIDDKMDELRQLEAEKKVTLVEKFGMVMWYTEIYKAMNL